MILMIVFGLGAFFSCHYYQLTSWNETTWYSLMVYIGARRLSSSGIRYKNLATWYTRFFDIRHHKKEQVTSKIKLYFSYYINTPKNIIYVSSSWLSLLLLLLHSYYYYRTHHHQLIRHGTTNIIIKVCFLCTIRLAPSKVAVVAWNM